MLQSIPLSIRWHKMSVLLLLINCCLVNVSAVTEHGTSISNSSAVSNSDTNLIITGKLLTHQGHLPVKNIELEIACNSLKGKTFKCVTDANGYFKFYLPDSLTAKDVILRPSSNAEELLNNIYSVVSPIKIPIDDFPFKKSVMLYKYNSDDQPKPVISSKLITQLTTQPVFAGGEIALLKFLQKNIQYPQMERDNDIQGLVSLRFMIDEHGEIKDIKLIKSCSRGLDKEAVRVVKMMPKWQPAMYYNKPVRVYYTLPVEFKIQ